MEAKNEGNELRPIRLTPLDEAKKISSLFSKNKICNSDETLSLNHLILYPKHFQIPYNSEYSGGVLQISD